MITISIDVTKLDKSRFKPGKAHDGHTSKYCDLVLIETPNSKFGDFVVKQSVSKEERESGRQMPMLGNGKNWSKPQTQQRSASASKPPVVPSATNDDVPF